MLTKEHRHQRLNILFCCRKAITLYFAFLVHTSNAYNKTKNVALRSCLLGAARGISMQPVQHVCSASCIPFLKRDTHNKRRLSGRTKGTLSLASKMPHYQSYSKQIMCVVVCFATIFIARWRYSSHVWVPKIVRLSDYSHTLLVKIYWLKR